jgi:hypothetical protein
LIASLALSHLTLSKLTNIIRESKSTKNGLKAWMVPERDQDLQRLRNAEQLRYSDVERALAEVLHVAPAQQHGAFRARIRHLRNIGVPSVSHPGQGRAADYCLLDALEILLGLRLQGLGVSPKLVAAMAHRLTLEYWYGLPGEDAGRVQDLHVFLFPPDVRLEDFGGGTLPPSSGRFDPENNPPMWFLRDLSIMPQVERKLPREFIRINISAWGRDIFRALRETAGYG